MKFRFLCSLMVSMGFASLAFARPEYAVKHGYVNCNACHFSAAGGGARNLNGKTYGTHGKGTIPSTNTDLISGDARMLGIVTEKPLKNSNGLRLMAAIANASIPISAPETGTDTPSEWRAVAGYSLGVLANGARDLYVLWTEKNQVNGLPNQVQIGRFNVPFGLMTDEHRTFVRIQSKTSFNDYEMGGMFSGDLGYFGHYDFALVNGFQSGGSLTANDTAWAVIGNTRWDTRLLPLFLGASGAWHHTVTAKNFDGSPYAFSAYALFSLDRLTAGALGGSVQGEAVVARGWNDSNRNAGMSYFIPAADVTLQSGVNASQSLGTNVMATFDVFPGFSLVYKFDSLALDRRFQGDSFYRHGAGFKTILNSAMTLNMRAEKGIAERPGVEESRVASSQDAVWALLHVYL